MTEDDARDLQQEDRYARVCEALVALHGVLPTLTFPTTDEIEACLTKAQQAADEGNTGACMEWMDRALVLLQWRRAWDARAYETAMEREA